MDTFPDKARVTQFWKIIFNLWKGQNSLDWRRSYKDRSCQMESNFWRITLFHNTNTKILGHETENSGTGRRNDRCFKDGVYLEAVCLNSVTYADNNTFSC